MIRLLIADDHDLVRRGLRMLINEEEDMVIVAEAENGREAILKSRASSPDVILLDLIMPDQSGIEALQEIKQENPTARILVLTSYSDDEKIFAAIQAGALGYLLKNSTLEELVQAIREVYQGECSLHPSIARKLIQLLNQPANRRPTDDPLTAREVDVLLLVAKGFTNQKIADQLILSERTVRTHVSNVLSKLHLANRTQAALYALKEGLATLDEAPSIV